MRYGIPVGVVVQLKRPSYSSPDLILHAIA